jgi:PKHD-type hydroxylase
METTIIFPTKEVDLQNYYFYPKGFSDDELDTIYKNVTNLPFVNAGTGEANDEDLSVRSSSIKWIPKDNEWAWLYDKMIAMIIEANNNLWNFDLYTVLDSIQYTEYHADKGGHYDWHQDIGPGFLSKRKVSITVQLSGPDEYTGGDLEYWKGGSLDYVQKAPKDKGVVFIFPSFMMHRVTKVETGIRRSFVLWVGGEHYK